MAKFEHIADQDAVNKFLEEVNAQCWRFGYRSQAALGLALDVSQVTAGKYLKDPDGMTFATIRKLVKVLKPNPLILLKAIGYTNNDLRQFVKELEQ